MRARSTARKLVLRRTRGAGFTLVELMAVVLITGVLAAIGVQLVRNHMNLAKTNRALAGISAIRAAEEAFRAENGTYLNCSTAANWYPMTTPGKTAYEWHQPSHVDGACWANLPLQVTGTTQYGYLVNAGPPAAYPTLQTAAQPTLDPSTDPWYVIQVRGNLDEDTGSAGRRETLGFAVSFKSDVYLEQEGQ